MFGLLNLHAVAAARGEGLRPELLEMLLRRRDLHAPHANIEHLEHRRADGLAQAGPNPARNDSGAADKVIVFPTAAATPDRRAARGGSRL